MPTRLSRVRTMATGKGIVSNPGQILVALERSPHGTGQQGLGGPLYDTLARCVDDDDDDSDDDSLR